jgi:hypothetical protein
MKMRNVTESNVPKIGEKNPAAALRDAQEALPSIKSIAVVAVRTDESMTVWASEPLELEKLSMILTRVALDRLGLERS